MSKNATGVDQNREDDGQLAHQATPKTQGHEADALREFAEFCHDYYAGTYKEAPWGEWRYGYHHEVTTMLELFLARERIVGAVVNDLAERSLDDGTE